LPLNFSYQGTSVAPTLPTVEEGATAILPVAGSDATCSTSSMLIMEASLSGRPQFGFVHAPSGSSWSAGIVTEPASSITATDMSA
jgi:hypothetical protein